MTAEPVVEHNLTARKVKTPQNFWFFKSVIFFGIIPFLVGMCGIALLDRIGTDSTMGYAEASVLPQSGATPYASGRYLRLAFVDKMSLKEVIGAKLGTFPMNEEVPPPDPNTLVADAVQSGTSASDTNREMEGDNTRVNGELDTWVSEMKGYSIARSVLGRDYGFTSPAVHPGKMYRQVEVTEGQFRAGDIIVDASESALSGEDAQSFTILRNGKLITFTSMDRSPVTTNIFDYPTVPKPMMPKGLSGPSAGLLYTVQYLDSMTYGSLLDGHTVAVTGVVDEETHFVIPVGAVREKIMGAKKQGAELVIIPVANANEEPDLLHIEGIRVVAVNTVAETVTALCTVYKSDDQLCPHFF